MAPDRYEDVGSDDWEERVDKFGGKSLELRGALGAGLEFVLLADEPVAVGLDRAGAEATGDEVGRLAVEREAVGSRPE